VISGSPTSSDVGTTETINADNVVWNFVTSPATTSGAVSFTSDDGPGATGAVSADGSGLVIPIGYFSISWSGGDVPVPATCPVPEASTLMAGAMMLLPLGIGALRAVRKAKSCVPAKESWK
jgi:hypothetical protein